jgi:hypothetical protein
VGNKVAAARLGSRTDKRRTKHEGAHLARQA